MDLDTTNEDPSMSSNIEGSVTICALNESNNDDLQEEAAYKDLLPTNVGASKAHECDSKVRTTDRLREF